MRQLPLFSSQPQSEAEISPQTPFGATFDLFRAFLKRSGKTANTIKSFMSDLNLVTDYTDPQRPVTSFKTSDLEKFLHWLENERTDAEGIRIPCSRKSYARRVTTLKVYFKWLRGLKAVPHDPAEAILQRSGPAPLSQVLSFDQIHDVIEAAQTFRKGDIQDYRPEFVFRMIVETGIKKSEFMRLIPADIDRTNPRNPILTVRHKARNVYRERRIDLDPDLIKLLDLYREQYPPKPDKDALITCTGRNLEYILKDLGEAAGISGEDVPYAERVKLSFEVLRWTCAVRDYRLGMEERDLREKLGLSEVSWYETSSKIRRLDEALSRQQA